MYKRYFPEKRYKITLAFLQEHLSTQETLLDLGVENPLSEQMRALGYTVKNTAGEDLDFNQNALIDSDASVVTAFEIFEHQCINIWNEKHFCRDTFLVMIFLK